MDRQTIYKKLEDGRIFRVTFVKSDGSERVMVARLGVKKHLKGGSKPFDDADKNLITCFDLQKQGYRSFRVDRVLELKEHGQVHDLREEQ